MRGGAVAGASGDGAARWLRADRHPCAFALAKVPALCDGITTMTSSKTGTSNPTVMEGLDPVTGTTTWQLQLGGAVDEFNSTATVLHIDDTTFLIATGSGPQTVDLRTGPTPARDPNQVGWCQPDLNAHDSITVNGHTADYLRSGGQFPCHLGGTPVVEPATLPIPDFAGAHTSAYSAWVVDGTVHAERNP